VIGAPIEWRAMNAPSRPAALEGDAPGRVAPSFHEKVAALHRAIDALRGVAVAFSGGVDSTLVLKVAHDRLGDRAVGVIGVSASLPPGELEEARALARSIGARLVEIATDELADPDYLANPSNRCFFCKSELYRRVVPWAREHGVDAVADGLNADDPGDWRPGAAAADAAQVRHPLLEAGFTKADVRALARELGLANWDKPALACLSSRVPYGTPITVPTLDRIGRAEAAVRRLGFPSVRVRFHGDAARIEVPPADLDRLFAARAAVVAAVKAAGFVYVALDLQGYRSGSANETLAPRAPAHEAGPPPSVGR
jgi:uncharacterized protein